MKIIDADTFVVFDLDDTLYKERNYQTSGIYAVAAVVKHAYGRDLLKKLLEWQDVGIEDIWGALCEELHLPMSAKAGFIWAYRLHKPNIELPKETWDIIGLIKEKSAGIAILTDGRSITQRLKATALGLSDYPLYISEEWESEKLELDRFKKIQQRHSARRYIYIGDNPKKDFKAPNELGWETIGLRRSKENIHSQDIEGLSKIYHPTIWISALEELREYLC